MLPARETLRAAYAAVIQEMEHTRGTQQLTNPFYTKIGGAIFDACYRALENSHAANTVLKTHNALQVVSAPMGAGKTTFALAFITALVRLTEHHGCVFLVEQMTKADEIFRELSALLPEKVAIWTTDHDVTNKTPTKVLSPA